MDGDRRANVAIVTGSNKGIGLGVVKALCRRFDGDVYLTARDPDKGLRAVDGLRALGLQPAFHQLDVTDADSVAALARHMRSRYPAGVGVLVNNAGTDVQCGPGASFAAAAEQVTRVNYFALRDVCDALFPLLSPGARVVNVSSSHGRLGSIPGRALRRRFASARLTVDRLDALVRRFVDCAAAGHDCERSGWPPFAYAVSKVAVTALTAVQQRAFDAEARRPGGRADIVVNSVHPGAVATDMTARFGSRPLTPDQGAETVVYLALLPADERAVRGQYVWHDKTVRDWRECNDTGGDSSSGSGDSSGSLR